MRKIYIIIFVLLSFAFAEDHSIAVLDFSGEEIHADELKSLSAQFRIELLKMDTLRVLDYDDMKSILEVSGYDSPSCNTMTCSVISSMLLDQEWMVAAHIAKIGEVYVVEAHLFNSENGRVLNVVTYDHELSIEGLRTRGIHNVAELLMSSRVPMEVHRRQNLVYIKTNPTGAMVRVGNDTLSGSTPMALDRVMLESRPIIILKELYEPYRLKQLPEDNSDIIYVELQRRVPQIGNVAFGKPLPEGIVIVSNSGEDRFLLKKGTIKFKKLNQGKYHLESNTHIINKGTFNIRHRRTTEVNPEIFLISDIVKEKNRYKLKRNIMIGFLALSSGYRTYLQFESESIYSNYGSSIEDGLNKHNDIEQLDNQKPVVDILSAFFLVPTIYFHAKYLEMDQWLKR
ncbi:MAG: PEGA domain-containing protein [Fidelibacterota bacterium]|jgi:hypothetical protein|tara:strand:- start:4921 stop:6117 length:1197 start_codon:yes stop_codon:yes gene_type:complete